MAPYPSVAAAALRPAAAGHPPTGGGSDSGQDRDDPLTRRLTAVECDRLDQEFKDAELRADLLQTSIEARHSKWVNADDGRLRQHEEAGDRMVKALEKMNAGGCHD